MIVVFKDVDDMAIRSGGNNRLIMVRYTKPKSWCFWGCSCYMRCNHLDWNCIKSLFTGDLRLRAPFVRPFLVLPDLKSNLSSLNQVANRCFSFVFILIMISFFILSFLSYRTTAAILLLLFNPIIMVFLLFKKASIKLLAVFTSYSARFSELLASDL